MLFKKTYTELVDQSITDLQSYTDITNISVGGVARSLLEVINKQLSNYYSVLEVNQAMGFLSRAQGYFLDLIGALMNVPRLQAQSAIITAADEVQKFYVTAGVLGDYIPSLLIPVNTVVQTSDVSIQYTVPSNTSFSVSATEVFVPIQSVDSGASNNVGINALISSNLGVDNVFTTNEKAIISASDQETDENYRYRISNAVLGFERANETAIRLAALSVDGVADVIMRPYARGIGSYEVLVIPTEGLAGASLLASVQTAIDGVQAYGIRGLAAAPTVVPLDMDIEVIFVDGVNSVDQGNIRSSVKTAAESYIVNIPIGGTFVLNDLTRNIMDTSPRIKDINIRCFYCRNQPTLLGNVEIYGDEMFYPNPDSAEAIQVI